MEQIEISYGSTIIPFALKRSDRKTMSITVQPDTTVQVTAPIEAELEKVKKKVEQKARWITKQQRFFENFLPATPKREYLSGETHLYLGRQYRLKVKGSKINSVKLIAGRIIVECTSPKNPDFVKQLLSGWYKSHAEKRFENAITENKRFFKKHDIGSPPLEIKRMAKRWGSCTPKGKIILNPEIIKAPSKCIDYVVIHELCHLVHHHHGKEFYELQEKIMPDWKRWKERLEKIMI